MRDGTRDFSTEENNSVALQRTRSRVPANKKFCAVLVQMRLSLACQRIKKASGMAI
jgi:hypothetical protein